MQGGGCVCGFDGGDGFTGVHIKCMWRFTDNHTSIKWLKTLYYSPHISGKGMRESNVGKGAECYTLNSKGRKLGIGRRACNRAHRC